MNSELERKYHAVYRRAFMTSITVPLVALIYIVIGALIEGDPLIMMIGLWIWIIISLIPVLISSVKVAMERRRDPAN